MVQVDQFARGIPGEYQIKRRLGQSQLGAAYLAFQSAQNRQVMITTFNLPEGISAENAKQVGQRVVREGEALLRLVHPQIVPIYDCGTLPGHLYLVTAFVKEASLGQFLKQNTRFTPQQALPIFKQLAAGLSYVHSQGVVHGTLSLSNVMVSSQSQIRITGFGLRMMLEMYEGSANERPLAHLTSAHGTFLGNPDYISPERVLGQPVDARSDIYALGIMLFELLSGNRPFSGPDPLTTAQLRLQQPVPSLHAVCPEVPEAFDLVLGNMLERNPAKRTQDVNEAVIAFEHILKTLNTAQWNAASNGAQQMADSQATLPPTVNWFDEPVHSGPLPDQTISAKMPAQNTAGNALLRTGLPAAAEDNPNSLGGIDPFDWWNSTAANQRSTSRTPGTFSQRPLAQPTSFKSASRLQSIQRDRRKLVTVIATGTAAAGLLTVGGISFTHFLQSMKQSQLANGSTAGALTNPGNTPATGSTPGAQKTPGQTPGPQPTHGAQGAPTPKPTQQQPTPTPKLNPTPTPAPGHTGTVIGSTNQATNSAITFTNPADGRSSLLIHLSNGTFVACERSCTHEGVSVNYNPGSKQIVCPAHNAIFDAQSFAHLSGPGSGSLANITIHVNNDGTITTG